MLTIQPVLVLLRPTFVWARLLYGGIETNNRSDIVPNPSQPPGRERVRVGEPFTGVGVM